MRERAEACRHKAEVCARMALLVKDDGLRKTYLVLAQQWRDMTEQAENLERRAAGRED